MKVRWRLILVAVLLPTIGVLTLALALGSIHAASLARDLDARLLAQAAVEAESLFDGEELPHLHTPSEPEAEALADAVSQRAIYRADGSLYLHQPPGSAVPASVTWRGPPTFDTPFIETADDDGGEAERRVTVRVRDMHGAPWILWLAAPLAPLDDAVAEFYTLALGIAAGMAALLALAVWPISRRLVRGIEGLVDRTLPHLHERRAEPLARVKERDEIDLLHNAIADAALRLAKVRETRDRLLAHAAHELRTPLSLMRTEIDLALRRERSASELKDALSGLRSEVDRLTVLTTGLLDLERLQSAIAVARASTDLVAVAQAALERFRAGEAKVELALQAPPACVVDVDPTMVRMALDNLVANAVKHAPNESRVSVTIADLRQAAVDGVRAGLVRLSVSDEGPGVPAAERERIFEPFYRSPGAPPGTGLGLAIVTQVATLHGGRAYVGDSARGATFVLELPV